MRGLPGVRHSSAVSGCGSFGSGRDEVAEDANVHVCGGVAGRPSWGRRRGCFGRCLCYSWVSDHARATCGHVHVVFIAGAAERWRKRSIRDVEKYESIPAKKETVLKQYLQNGLSHRRKS